MITVTVIEKISKVVKQKLSKTLPKQIAYVTFSSSPAPDAVLWG